MKERSYFLPCGHHKSCEVQIGAGQWHCDYCYRWYLWGRADFQNRKALKALEEPGITPVETCNNVLRALTEEPREGEQL